MFFRLFRPVFLLCLLLCVTLLPLNAQPAASNDSFTSPITLENLDAAAFAQWIDGVEKPLDYKDGPRHVIWTQNSAPEWDGVTFGVGKKVGARHLRLAWKTPLLIGSVLARGGGQLSVLKTTATYPGNLADEAQWLPAQRISGTSNANLSSSEVTNEDYALWVLPPNTSTRALRFTHTPQPTDHAYAGWLGGVFVLTERWANVAPQAIVTTRTRGEAALRINNNSNDGTWNAWDNGANGGVQMVSESPEWLVMVWPRAVSLRGLNALWAGFGAAEVQSYSGPDARHPREATDADWKTVKQWEGLENQYPRAIGVNWLDFGQTIQTRALRLRLTKVTTEGHGHLNGNTKGGKRVWLGELMALQPLATAELKTALLPLPAAQTAPHAPIPVRFTLPHPAFVTLVIEGMSGRRVRNLVSETYFPAGANVVWWDGLNDLARDPEAARHGLYNIPAQLVEPGEYRVRGLYRKALDLRYEFSVYNAGNPAWDTQDGTGGWLTNHTPPSSTLFVPANARDLKSTPQVLLGSFISEGGSGLAGVNLEGRKQWGRGWIGGNWTAAPYLARDAGDKAAPEAYAYVGAPWKGELRLTALTPSGDKAVLSPSFKFPGTTEQEKKDSSVLGGIAVHNSLLAATLPKQNQLLFVDSVLNRQRAVTALSDGRGVAFDAQGRLLVLSGKNLLRYALPSALSPVTRLDSADWTPTASTHPEDAVKVFDADAGSRWSTNDKQAPGQSFTVDMKTRQSFSTLVLKSDSDRDSPKAYELAVSDDGQNWKSVATGAGAPGTTAISLPPTTTRYFKITQTGASADSWWSINSLILYNVPPVPNGTVELPGPEILVANLEDPQGITTDAAGRIYVSERGNSHQVKVFDAQGKSLRAIGRAGAPKAGPYDPNHMNNPKGLTVDANGRLWVAEDDYQPKRVSVWDTASGALWKAFYGPSQYGGGGTLDSRDPSRFYYTGMEFKLDWKSGENHPINVFFRPGADDLPLPDGYGAGGQPETPVYVNGRQYLTNCYNSNPTNGASIAGLWLMGKDNIARPVALMGQANDWSLLKGDEFKAALPVGADLKRSAGDNSVFFIWQDANGDAHLQAPEVTFRKVEGGGVDGVTVMADASFVVANLGGQAERFKPQSFDKNGVPRYAAVGEVLVKGTQHPVTSGGGQALNGSDGWTIFTNAPQPFSAYGLGGARNGVPLWSYPSMWPGLHASHEAPPPSFPGQIIGTTRLIGGMVTPKGEAGPLWSINGNMGNMYLFTQDGLFVAQLFQDVRQGKLWTMPSAERGIKVNDISLHDENFWPTIAQTPDGTIYLNSSLPNIVRVDGLETIKRIAPTPLRVTSGDLQKAQAFQVQAEAARQQNQGKTTLEIALQTAAPVVDGKVEEWQNADWASIDKRGVGANFNSDSKPYDVTGAVAISGERLFAAWRTTDRDLLRNSGEVANAPFKTGGALDLMIGTNAEADPKRANPVAGDVRLLITRVGAPSGPYKTLAVLYRSVVAGTTTPVPFSSPWRTVTIDRVEDISAEVQWAGDEAGNYEISVPLAILGLKPTAGQTIKADIGILRGTGTQTTQRVYWSNKATGITADVPSEAQLTPQLWGSWHFKTAP